MRRVGFIFIIEDMSARRASDPASRLPLRPVAFSTLAALAEGTKAGFAILSAVNDTLPGTPILGPGTLYRLLRELSSEGLIEPVAAPKAQKDDDARRQYYALTAEGHATLRAEAERLRATLAAARLLDPRTPRR